MTMDNLFAQVENAIAQLEQAKQTIETASEMRRQAEQRLYYLQAQASSSEDASDQLGVLEAMRSVAMEIKGYDAQIQNAQAAQTQAQRYLIATQTELNKVVQSITEKLPAFDKSLEGLGQMASVSSFGSQAVSAQYQKLSNTRADYQKNLDDAYALLDRIDSALNGGGTSPRLVLRR